MRMLRSLSERELPFEQIRTSSNFITGILEILLQPISSKRAVSLQFNASSLSLRPSFVSFGLIAPPKKSRLLLIAD
jgi:hypothetical protein